MNRFLTLISATLIGSGIVASAAADDKSTCFGPPYGDHVIAACTRLISSKTLPAAERVKAYYQRGRSYVLGKSDFDRGVADFNEVIRLDPTNLNALVFRGASLVLTGKLDRGLEDLSAARRLNPNAAIVHNGFGVYYNAKGEYDRAIIELNEAIRLAPQFFNAYRNRGISYEGKGDLARALADFRVALSFDPEKKDIAGREAAEGLARVEKKLAAERSKPAAVAAATPAAPAQPSVAVSPPSASRPAPPPTGNSDYESSFDQALADFRKTQPSVADPPRPQPPPVAAPVPAAPSVATLPPATAPSTPQARVALVIGNGNYRHATRLANPANDAADIAQALRKLGFDVIEGRDLDKRGMEDKVREFGRKLDRADLALFFYAGHGIQVAGRNYLIPVDAKLERPGDLNFDTVDVSFILAQMEAEQRVNLVFLDACRDNPLTRSFARSLGTRSASVGQGLATMHGAVGTLIAFATGPDTVALDGEGRNSPFTSALLKHLATPGLHVSLMMQRVRADVVRMTRSKQVPWDHSSLVGDVILAR
jgi:tetratricopeptide (TPR) repeat protein